MARKPDFIIVGPPKTGTTSLWYALKSHPEIGMPEKKELHFFENEENYAKGLEWYLSHFDDLEHFKITGEVTPSYFASSTAKARMLKDLPETKIICMLREPVARLVSQHTHFHSTYLQLQSETAPPTFIEEGFYGDQRSINQLTEELQEAAPQLQSSLYEYIAAGEYYPHIRDWQDLFGAEHVYLMFFEELIRSPVVEIGKLLRWLGVTQQRLELEAHNRAPDWKRKSGRTEIYEELTLENKTWLKEHFKPYNELLFDYLNIYPSIWEDKK